MNDLPLSDTDVAFIDAHPHAAMITVAGDGRPKAAKIEAAFVDGRLASSSQADKVRTRRVRHDPRCTLYFPDIEHRWLAIEADVEIIDGPAAPGELLRYFRIRDRNPAGPIDYHSDRSDHSGLDDDGFLQVMADERAVLYRFTITKAYGNR